MNCRMCQRLGLCALLLCCLSTTALRARAAQGNVPSFINPTHRQIVQNFLKTRPYLRVATYADAEHKEALESVSGGDYGENKSPYYAVGDFNHDGREDFAVAFVNTRQPKQFVVAVFNGPFRNGKAIAPAYYNEKRFGTDDFLLALTEQTKHDLQIGIGTDLRTVLLKSKRGRYYVWEGATQ